ncbi:hypothetical protein BCV70DRAFT_202880 [Testicularia cyperi]|uniref:Cupin type-2 domain-containing protein n=1 Tax=Testicularia cyperi TaxID=1882483 RepID=A0A317XJB3_9BASI|nr:hypothetical protein BCV70DRAFT_202880 [Testicularia cyperi]
MDSVPAGGIRRVVTGHREDGRATVIFDDEVERLDLTPEHATFAVVWSTSKAPADNAGRDDGAVAPIFSGGSHNVNGSVLRFVDFPPHTESPMHRTQSIDYGIVIWGEIELELDSGEKRTLGPSDVCVQRGSDHLWRNKTDKWVRVAYVLLDAEPLYINGQRLGDKGFPDGKH